MKKIIFFILVLGTVFLVKDRYFLPIISSIDNIVNYSVCDKQIPYRIGTIDPRFNISAEEFKTVAKQAVSIWEEVEGKQLFVFDSEAALNVNLIFDEKQYFKNQIDHLGNRLQQEKKIIEPEIDQYDSLVAEFEKQLADFREKVSYWNSRGGAPSEEYEKLFKEQEELRQKAAQINQMGQTLNQSTERYNEQIAELNQTITSFNQALSARPEEGLYSPKENKIDIYFNITRDGLIHTLAHEFGHALGLGGHTSDPTSIMHRLTNETVIAKDEDINALQQICLRRNIFEVAYSQLINRLAALNLGI